MIRELLKERSEKIASLEELIRKAEEEKRLLSDEEVEKFDKVSEEVEKLTSQIDKFGKFEEIKTRLKNASQEDIKLGMDEKEVRSYSIVRAIRAAASGDWRGAELEKEASDETARKLGREPRGFFVPFDVYQGTEKRDLVKGTGTLGGFLVETDLLAEAFIDVLRAKLITNQAGATTLSGLIGDIAIPRQSGSASAFWVSESGAPTESDLSFGQVAMSPKTVGGFTDISRKLLLQSSVDVEALVRNDLAAVIARAIDRAAFHGSGTAPEPRGIQNQPGVTIVSIGANGGAPTWSHIVQLETEVAVQNADVGRLAYVTNPRVRGRLKATETFVGGGIPVWQTDNTVNGYRALVSTLIRSDLTKGTGANLSAIFYGNFQDLLIGLWGTLDILVDPYTQSTSGTVRVVALQDVDIAVRWGQSFSMILDAVT